MLRTTLRGGAILVLAALASCGIGSEPRDATLQVDDFPAPQLPTERLNAVAGRKFGACSPAKIRQLINQASNGPRPEMMAIGGSIFNGVSSMQINWWLADWSPPAQVARALYDEKPDGSVPVLNVPAYPDYGRDPYGNSRGTVPTFRLGLDLETVNVARIETGVRRQGRVMKDFQGYVTTRESPKAHVFNDNLSSGGAAIEDILYGTPRDYRARMQAVKRSTRFMPDMDDFWGKVTPARTYGQILEHAPYVNGISDVSKTAAALNTVFYAQNASFILNPTGNDCLEDMTALDQVLLRKPKRLLVGVGSNSGLFTFLYSGQRVDDICGDTKFSYGPEVREWKRYVSIRQTSDDEFISDMGKMLDKLAIEGRGTGKNDGIKYVYVMGQLRPRVIANLKPGPGQGNPGPGGHYPPNQVRPAPPGTDYYAHYLIDFGPAGTRPVRGTEVQKADLLNWEVNRKLRKMVEERNVDPDGPHFVFVDLEPISNQYDFKHDPNAKRVTITKEHLRGLKSDIKLDNRVLSFSYDTERLEDGTPIGQRIQSGGLFSIDNLHPTVVGYALLAQSLLEAITKTEPLTASQWKPISPEMAYARSFKRIENGKEIDRNGNVLRRVDPFLASRAEWYQIMFDLAAGDKGLDCWRKPGDETW